MIVRAEHVMAELAGVELAERAHAQLVLDKAAQDPSSLARAPRPAAGKPAERPSAIAYVNHGRWVCDCPFPGCNSAQIVSPADARFFCAECFNAVVEGRYLRVHFPPKRKLERIERVLEERPLEETRNWLPQESLADLVAENEEHGL